jgi:hypothetical protein
MIKVFGLGLSKTATNSLTVMLKKLKFKVSHFTFDPYDYDRFDAVTDIPAACEYRALDVRFPQAKFILTTRPMETWLESCERHFVFKPSLSKEGYRWRLRIYGAETFDREKFIRIYQDHQRTVTDYFKTFYPEGGKLLEIDLTDKERSPDDIWEELAGFLGRRRPARGTPVPWVGKGKGK